MAEEVELISPLKDHHFVETFFDLSSKNHFWFQWRFGAFFQQIKILQIPLQSSIQVLDVGAGRGVLREQVEGATNWIVDNTDMDYKDAAGIQKRSRENVLL